MRKKIIYIISIIILSTSFIACSSSDDDILIREKFPLMDFSVKVGDSYYHGKIDQDTRRVEIGGIENANSINDVQYKLMSDSATVFPDPNSFKGS